MKLNNKNNGFSLIEVIFAMMIMLVGVLGAMTAITASILNMQGSEKRTISKEIVRSSMETIFSIRDLLAFDSQIGGTQYNWTALQNSTKGGIFIDGWTPIRESPGIDGIFGTSDDSCPAPNPCIVNGIANNSPITEGYLRKIDVQDIVENGVVRKRLFTLRVKYFVGRLQIEENQSTIIVNLPLN